MTIHPGHTVDPDTAAAIIADQNALDRGETPPAEKPAETPPAEPEKKDDGFAAVTRALSDASARIAGAADRLAETAERPAAAPAEDAEIAELQSIIDDPDATPREIKLAQANLRTLQAVREREAEAAAARDAAAEDRIEKQEAAFRAQYPGVSQEEINRAYAVWEKAIDKDPAAAYLNFDEVVRRMLGPTTLEARRGKPAPPANGGSRPGAPAGRVTTTAVLGTGAETGKPWEPPPGATLHDAEKAALAALGHRT